MKTDIAARFACAVFAMVVPLAAWHETTVAGAMLLVDWTSIVLMFFLAAASALVVLDILFNSTTLTRRSWPWLAHRRWTLYMATTVGLISAPFTASRVIPVDIFNGWIYLGGSTVVVLVWLSDMLASMGVGNEKTL